MTTSGSIDFSLTRNQIVQAALRKLGVASRGTDPDADDIAEGAEALEAMVKAWDAQGIHLWKYDEVWLFPTPGVADFTFIGGDNTSAGANATTAFDETTLSASAVATDTTITVADASDIASGDFILVVLDTKTYHSTTVNGAPAGNVVTLTDAMPAAASSGNAVISFTKKISRPLKVHDIRRRISGQDTTVLMIAREEYNRLPNKADTGTPNQAFYNPNLTNGQLKIWPTAETTDIRLQMTVSLTLEDFDTSVNTPDFPQEWYQCLVFNLALTLAPEYTVDDSTFQKIKILADEYLDDAKNWDREDVSIYFQPTDQPHN
jgi:hypothetical protein